MSELETVRQAMRDRWTEPMNFCDRRCEQCPLAGECPVPARLRERRSASPTREPESPGELFEVLEELDRDLGEAHEMLTKIIAELGDDFDDQTPPPTAIDEMRLRRASDVVSEALGELRHAEDLTGGALTAALSDTLNLWLTLAPKAARIVGLSADRRDALWLRDAIPNLFVVQLLRPAFDDSVTRLEAALDGSRSLSDVQSGLAAFDRILQPLFDLIEAEDRSLLEAAVRLRLAPSPFCISPETEIGA